MILIDRYRAFISFATKTALKKARKVCFQQLPFQRVFDIYIISPLAIKASLSLRGSKIGGEGRRGKLLNDETCPVSIARKSILSDAKGNPKKNEGKPIPMGLLLLAQKTSSH